MNITSKECYHQLAPNLKICRIVNGMWQVAGGHGYIDHELASENVLGAEVSVLSHSLKKQEDGMRMGADNFYATSDPETFNKLKGYFDLIINTLSIEIKWDDYLGLLGLDGTMVVVGIPEKQTPINPSTLIMALKGGKIKHQLRES